MCLCVFFEEVWCQPPRLAFFVGRTFASIKNLQGNVNWPGGRRGWDGNHYFIFSLPPSPCTHMCTNAFLLQQGKAATGTFLARPPVPGVLFACHGLAKEQQINAVLCFLLPEGKIHRPLPRVSPRAAAAPRGSNARVPVGCGIIMKCRGTRSANDHPVALFLWAVFSISLFSWIRSFYPTFRSGKQQVSLQRDTAEFSNPENLGLFFIFLFSCSRMSENKLTQLIHWIYTLSQCKLTSPSSAFFFPVIAQCSRAVSQDGAVLWSLVLMWNTTSKSNAFFFLSCDLVRYQSFLWLQLFLKLCPFKILWFLTLSPLPYLLCQLIETNTKIQIIAEIKKPYASQPVFTL